MRIGFDAKRAYHNTTGLGNYSRTLIESLAERYPEHHYFLYNPNPSLNYKTPVFNNLQEVLPSTPVAKKLRSFWRSIWLTNELNKHDINLYHGLSHELPRGINKSGITSVVTIHDLIFELYPEQFIPVDVLIFREKFRHACKSADRIIAISDRTKKDITKLYAIDESKIDVCYQSCHTMFERKVTAIEKERIRRKYNLPPEYFLYVGSIIERKNLLAICKALYSIKDVLAIPLVVVGNGKRYKEKVKQYIERHNLRDRVIFVSEMEHIQNDQEFNSSQDLPALYQMATAMIYPSFYEGFGLPVLEALWSGIPVITSSVSCLPEAGGPGAFYINPQNPLEIATAMLSIGRKQSSLERVIEEGYKHARRFSIENTSSAIMEVYYKAINRT